MAKYFSVEEVAEALKTTERTVRRMLNDGRLSGSQHLDKGKMIWRVNATKEILAKLERSIDIDPIDVEPVPSEHEPVAHDEAGADEATWRQNRSTNASAVIEQIWDQLSDKFLEKLSAKDQLIGELRHDLQDRERQLKLLPDLEKRHRDEVERSNLEFQRAQALEMQIEAIKVEFEGQIGLQAQELEQLRAQALAAKTSWWSRLLQW